MNTFYWLVKREYWEHSRRFFWAPIVASAIFLAINLMAIITGESAASRFGIAAQINGSAQIIEQISAHGHTIGAILDITVLSAAMIAGVVLTFVVFFYCLGSLYDDRRDRSVLFWKSMPVSASETVLSKFFSAAITAPVIVTIVGVITGVATLLMLLTWGAVHGLPMWPMLKVAHPVRILATLIALIPVNIVWALPTLGWLMMVSAWARSKPFLWAVGIPVGAGVLLSWFQLTRSLDTIGAWFWEHIVARLLLGVIPFAWLSDAADKIDNESNPNALLDLFSLQTGWGYLQQPEAWLGAIAGMAMIAAAIWFRSHRNEA